MRGWGDFGVEGEEYPRKELKVGPLFRLDGGPLAFRSYGLLPYETLYSRSYSGLRQDF